eukprot:GFUD01044817.1.p1 GENE.GFUD01044817.1~~GFUD01044817.1.p1  ORF type:complete len:956 (+),score=375.88 GFUD01044817.1:80-2947(+)
MLGSLRFFLFLGVAHSFTSGGKLDLSELHSVQYSVEILDTPVVDTPEDTKEQSVSPSMTMVNKDGQKYRCSLPEIPDSDSDAEKNVGDQETDVAKLLSPLEQGPCMYKTKDWWTYEICYNRAVKQYHVENDQPVGLVLVLGVHSPGLDSWGQSNKTYQPQWYTNGSSCDLTGRPRQSELRFVCNEAATQEFVGDIFEPQSCEYTIVVHTSRLCSVPWLRPVADPTPLPIVCHPMLSQPQMEKYQLYQERKKVAEKLAEKESQAKKTAELASKMGAKQVGAGKTGGQNSLAGLLDSMGDSVADNLVAEINTLLEKAMAGDGGIKVIDLRDKDKEKEQGKEVTKEGKESISKPAESMAADGKWDLIHHKHQPVSDPAVQELITERNTIWRKIHEAKKTVKKYTSQLHDTDTFLKNEKVDTFENKEIVDKLEQQKKTIEKALVNARETVADLEVNSKDISHKIVSTQNKLRQSEEKHWKRKISILEDMMKKGSTDYTIILKEMATDYRKARNERLIKIDDYFKVAQQFLTEGDDLEGFKKLRLFMQFADGELLNIEEEEILEEEDEIFGKEIENLSKENIETAAKFRDVVKDDVRHKFSDILKEVSKELELPEGDVDKDEAMAAMTKTLDQLMNKLSGAGEQIDKVQKHVADLKKISADKDGTDDMVSLKRDNTKSVKKELRENRADIMPDDENEEEDEDEELDIKLKDTMQKLEEAEAEVETLEKEFLHLSKSDQLKEETATEASTDQAKNDLKNVKVSVTNLSPGGDSLDTEQTNKIVKKLEGTIREKLSKLGLDTGGRPIEVKLITTQIPEGLGDGMEGEGDDMQVQGMFFNMMTGNIQGYEDINSQRKVENNYKFSWSEDLVEDIEKKIEGLGGEEYISHGERNIKHQNEPEEVALTDSGNNVIDIYEGGDQRSRPSSATEQTNENVGGEMIIDDEIFTDSDEEDEDDQNKDEL